MDFLLRRPESYKKKKDFKFQATLGTGSFGEVKRATWTTHNPPIDVAIKIIRKKSVRGQEHIVYDEMDVLKELDHQNIAKFYDWFESKEKFYLVFQLADGGELFERICERGKFTEADSMRTIKSILHGVQYLHSKEVVHRDLKPENLLFEHPGSEQLLIADFGIARHLASPDEVLTTMAGSPGYAAPEVLNRKGHGKPVDMWAIGVITYTLLCGYPPFRAENRQELIAETTRARVDFHDKYWKRVSQEAKDFILALIKADPKERLTVEGALKHHWLRAAESLEHHDISDGLKENWNAKRRWKMAISGVQFAVRLQQLGGSTPGGSRAASLSGRSSGDEYHSAGDTDTDTDTDYDEAEGRNGSAPDSGRASIAGGTYSQRVSEGSNGTSAGGRPGLPSLQTARPEGHEGSIEAPLSTPKAGDSAPWRFGPGTHKTMTDKTARRVSSEIQEDTERKMGLLHRKVQELGMSSSGSK